MEWHAYEFSGKSIVEKGKVSILGKGTNPMNFIAVKDIVATLKLVILNEEFYNETVSLGGPENLSRNEVAERFGKALKIHPKISHVPAVVLKFFAVLLKPLHPGFARIMKFTLYTDTSNQVLDENFTIARFALKPTTIDEFIHSVTGK